MEWQQRLRRFQDAQSNEGWRIKLIPCDDAAKPMVYFNGWAALGALGFCAGISLIFYNRAQTFLGLKIAVVSLAFSLLGVWFKPRQKQRRRQEVSAQCVDRELRKIWNGEGYGWYWRVVCEYQLEGQTYRVTPHVPQLINSSSEPAAMKFFTKRVKENGECRLSINPQNPLEAKLMCKD